MLKHRMLSSRLLQGGTLLPLVLLVGSTTCASQGVTDSGPVKIVLVGDSTTAQMTGWGGAFCDAYVSGMVACLPMGRGGRSTKTYRAEGSWQLVLNELKTPGYKARYVLIEMGHNDKNADPAIGTRLGDEFPANLARFVTEARATGAIPLLVTPLSARHFANGRLDDTIKPWADQVRDVAAKMHTPVIDLNEASEALYGKMGAARAMAFESHPVTAAERQAAARGATLPGRIAKGVPVSAAVPAGDPRRSYQADYIHLNAKGAYVIAGLVADGLRKAEPSLGGLVKG